MTINKKAAPIISSEQTSYKKPKGPVILDHEGDTLSQKLSELQSQMADYERRKALADEQASIEQQREYYELLENAERFRAESKEATDPDERKQLLTFAFDAERQAEKIGHELGIISKKSWFQHIVQQVKDWFQQLNIKSEWYVPFIQLSGLMTVIAWCYHKFFALHDEIVVNNSTVETYDQVRPLGLDSIQKMYLMFLNVGFDVVFVLGIIGIFSPKLLLYLLPFLNSKNDFSNDFEKNTTPWQRLVIVSAFLLGLLLYLSLSHMGKSV